MCSNQGDISGSDFLPWEMTELHWTASQPWRGQQVLCLLMCNNRKEHALTTSETVRHSKWAGLDKYRSCHPYVGQRDSWVRPAQPAEGQMHEVAQPQLRVLEREEACPAPTPTCVAHLPQHVSLQRLGDLARDSPEQPPTRVSPSGMPEAGAQGEAGPAQGPWGLPLLAPAGLVTGRAGLCCRQGERADLRMCTVRGHSFHRCSDPLLKSPCRRVTLSPLCQEELLNPYIHRTLFSHHILPKQFFTWNLLTNKREGTTDKMIISKEIKSVLILKLKKCLVFHQPLILNEPERGWGGGQSARKRALSNGAASPFTAWSQTGRTLWSPDTSLRPCPTVTCSTSSARVSTRSSPFKKQNTYTGLRENCRGWRFTSWCCWWAPDCTFIKTCQTGH